MALFTVAIPAEVGAARVVIVGREEVMVLLIIMGPLAVGVANDVKVGGWYSCCCC